MLKLEKGSEISYKCLLEWDTKFSILTFKLFKVSSKTPLTAWAMYYFCENMLRVYGNQYVSLDKYFSKEISSFSLSLKEKTQPALLKNSNIFYPTARDNSKQQCFFDIYNHYFEFLCRVVLPFDCSFSTPQYCCFLAIKRSRN